MKELKVRISNCNHHSCIFHSKDTHVDLCCKVGGIIAKADYIGNFPSFCPLPDIPEKIDGNELKKELIEKIFQQLGHYPFMAMVDEVHLFKLIDYLSGVNDVTSATALRILRDGN